VPVSALPFGWDGIEAVMTGATQVARNAQPFKEVDALICPENETGSRVRFAISFEEAWVTQWAAEVIKPVVQSLIRM